MHKLLTALSLTGVALALVLPTQAHAATTCTFADNPVDKVMTLQGDCTTTETIHVPDEYVLDGFGYRITAMDNGDQNFKGAVVKNASRSASIVNLGITTASLADVCDAGDDRLRGVLLDGASGRVISVTVANINQGASGCQEGNAIEVRNAPFDNTHPHTQSVEIAYNTVKNYQKTGILVNGDVNAHTHHNTLTASVAQANLAANTIQYGFGATGKITDNQLDGNQWLGASDYVGTAILLYLSDGTRVKNNHIQGNSDVGIYGYADNMAINSNVVMDQNVDGPHGDYGIGNWGTNTTVANNRVSGFVTAYDGPFTLLMDALTNRPLPSISE